MTNDSYQQNQAIPNWIKYFIGSCILFVVLEGVYLNKNPEVAHPRKVRYENVISIPDMNKDSIPELKVKLNDGSIDTLLSNVNGEIVYRK
jgi:hypothetical protein